VFQHLFDQGALDGQVFGDGFYDPVAVLYLGEVVFEVAGVTSDLVSGVKKAAGFCFSAVSNPPRAAALRLA